MSCCEVVDRGLSEIGSNVGDSWWAWIWLITHGVTKVIGRCSRCMGAYTNAFSIFLHVPIHVGTDF
jgi:hypothetical protein